MLDELKKTEISHIMLDAAESMIRKEQKDQAATYVGERLSNGDTMEQIVADIESEKVRRKVEQFTSEKSIVERFLKQEQYMADDGILRCLTGSVVSWTNFLLVYSQFLDFCTQKSHPLMTEKRLKDMLGLFGAKFKRSDVLFVNIYREGQEEDSVHCFLARVCETDNSGKIMPSANMKEIPNIAAFFRCYREWCNEMGQEAVGKKDFRATINRMGIDTRKSGVTRVYVQLNKEGKERLDRHEK